MDRNEFVSTLRAVLTGEVPASVVEDSSMILIFPRRSQGGRVSERLWNPLGSPG